MPVDRALFTATISENQFPRFACPTCRAGHFEPVNGSLHVAMSAASSAVSGEDWFDPEDSELRFSMLVKCDNQQCGESSAVVGSGTYESFSHDMQNLQYVAKLRPQFFQPSPAPIRVPASTPERVKGELERSFVLFWGDCAGAAGHFRSSVEFVLDALRVPRTRIGRDGKRRQIQLHARIESIESPRLAEARTKLLAIKWIGNVGSHAGQLNLDDIFDAYDLLEFVLSDLFENARAKADRLARRINKRKGPRSKRRSKRA